MDLQNLKMEDVAAVMKDSRPGEPPTSRFKIQSLAELDPLTEYRFTARLMEVGQCVDKISPEDAKMLAKAIDEVHGERSARIETLKDQSGLRRVIRIEQRPKRIRTPKVATTDKPAKKRAAKTPAAQPEAVAGAAI